MGKPPVLKPREVAGVYGDKIYLTGGTALSRFYFQHRLSEDLDFFTTTDDLKLIANDLAGRLQARGFIVEIDKLDVYFGRIFAQEKDLKLKIEFVREFNLWDFPIENRKLDEFSKPVLKKRLKQLPLPERKALENVI